MIVNWGLPVEHKVVAFLIEDKLLFLAFPADKVIVLSAVGVKCSCKKMESVSVVQKSNLHH